MTEDVLGGGFTEQQRQDAEIDVRAEIYQISTGIVLAGGEPTVEAIAEEMERRHATVLPPGAPDADFHNYCTRRGLRIIVRQQLGLPEEDDDG
jgi:hypothetical protein